MIRSLLVAVCLSALASVATAQDTAESQQNDVARIKAETELLKAQTEQFKAEQEAEKARKQVEIDRLASEKAILDSRAASEKQERQDELDKLKAQKELIAAASPNVTGAPAGTASFDDKAIATIENTAMAYQAVDNMARDIATAIGAKITGGDNTFIILSATDVGSLTSLAVFETQAALITKRLDDINKLKDDETMQVPTDPGGASSPLLALGLLGPSINAVTSVISLFRADQKYAVVAETPNLRAVYGALGGKLSGTVYFPEVVPAHLFDRSSPVQTTLGNVVDALDRLRTTYFARLSDKAKVSNDVSAHDKNVAAAKKIFAEIATIDQELAGLGSQSAANRERRSALEKQKAEKTAALPDGIKDATVLTDRERLVGALKLFLDANDKYLAILEAVLKSGDDYVAAMTRSDATTASPLLSLVGAERLRRLYRPDGNATPTANTYAIEMTIEKLSGTRKEHRNFFGTSLSVSGGVVGSYRVFQASTGRLIVSGTAVALEPFTKLRER